ncbi:MAG: hypothetical protein J6U20_00670 [Fibrobacter sp.]|nr:hypothetical protein [Fibrobacter sp.]MBP5441468.1 hypothetical protein [Fibrobacter sp.]
MADNPIPDEEIIDEGAKEKAFIKAFCDKVNGLVGGDNPDEHLCLMVPGISLKKEDYVFDKVKSPTVEANESRLVNKLYDPLELVNSDNGRTLPNQYLSALNLLTPKLNTVIAKAKNELRKLLMKKYPYTFVYADGTKEYRSNSTFQEVYFYLYSEYLETMQKWAKKQTEQIAKLGRGTDEYLEWYQNNAEVELNIINQKRAKLMSMFSPNDMKILEGVLDSGSGAELQEARQLMNNLKKMNPDGSYTYPVTLYPSDWHKYLETSFTPVDLLDSPEKLADELRVLAFRKNALLGQIEAISEQIPDSTAVANACQAAREAEQNCDDAFAEMALTGEQAGFTFIVTTVKSICNVCNSFNKVDAAKVGKQDASNEDKQKAEKSCDQAKTVSDKILVSDSKDDESQEESKSILDKVKEGASKILSGILSGSNSDVIKTLSTNENCNKLLTTLKSKLGIDDNTNVSDKSKIVEALEKGGTEVKDDQGNKTGDVANAVLKAASGNVPAMTVADAVSQVVSEVFSEVQKEAAAVDKAQNSLIVAIGKYLETQSTAADLENRSQLNSTLSTLKNQLKDVEGQINSLYTDLMISSNNREGSGVEPPVVPEGFTQFVLTHQMKSTSDHSESIVTTSTTSKKTGCWIFKKTRKTTTYDAKFEQSCFSDDTKIEIGMNLAKVGIEREWFNPGVFLLTSDMYRLGTAKISSGDESFANPENASNEVFPCYSTALLIARDITIKITNSSSSFTTASRNISSKSSSSRSFFVFHTGDGSSAKRKTSDTTTRFDGHTMTMRFSTPQVIGVYLHTVPEDMSKPYVDGSADKDGMIITEFVKTYKAILDEYITDEQNTEAE